MVHVDFGAPDCALSVAIRWKTTSCIEAARQPPEMLAAPGHGSGTCWNRRH